MAERWLRSGHRVVGNNRSSGPIDELATKDLDPAYALEELVEKLQRPRAVWVMLPAGAVTEGAIQSPIPLLEPGDTIVDGGSGHFVKMVHNGIEYGMMQAYAEGFEIMRAKKEFDLDLHGIASAWHYGSVVRSWLLELTEEAPRVDPSLGPQPPRKARGAENAH